MAEDEPAPEPDRVGDAPHPRETARLFGQQAAEDAFLSAWRAGRLHHAWLLAGPRGVGKATLAYRMARARLAHEDGDGLFGASEPPGTLDLDPEHPVARRVLAGSEPRLFTLRRTVNDKTGRLNTVIRVDDVRRLRDFFQLTAADGGWRAAIVDPAEEMNAAAANALLKFLEEPPARTVLLLVSHAPARLLPTIRSRCRALNLAPLGPEDLSAALAQAGMETGDAAALAALSGGSAGEAVRLIEGGGAEIYAGLAAMLSASPMDRKRMIALAQACAGREAAETYDLTIRLVDLLTGRLARAGALGPPQAEAAPGEAALIGRLAPDEAAARIWADAGAEIADKAAGARAVNLDPAQTMLDIFLTLEAAARKARPRAA